jgi:type I restriction enzyme S subunit
VNAGWPTRPLGEVSSINYGYTESASENPVGPKFLRITDIQNDSVDWNKVPYCEIDAPGLRKYRLSTGDIVFARTGATTGKSFLVTDPPEAVFASYLIRLRVENAVLLPEFVYLFFQTEKYWKSIQEGSTGSAQGGFNATKLGALSIPVPPLPKQGQIVSEFAELKTEIEKLAAVYSRKLISLDALKKSLLQQIFPIAS